MPTTTPSREPRLARRRRPESCERCDPSDAPDARRRSSLTRRSLLGGLAGTGLAAVAGSAWALDRFVIDDVQIDDVDAYEAARSGVTGTSASPTAATVTDTTYSSDLAAVTIRTRRTGSGSSTVSYFVADVKLDDATVLRSAFAQNSFGQNIIAYPSEIATSNNAVLAVNGDYYGFRDTGIVVRNGVAYRNAGAREGMAFYRDGQVRIYDETATTADRLVSDGVWNTLSFGPTVVTGGAVVPGIDSVEVDTNFGNHSIQGDQPRTAIGVVEENHLLLVVVDGRSTGYSEGVTLPELAEILLAEGARTGYNLDGGGSSTLWFNGSLVNNPLGKNKERGTSDILYIEM